MTKASAVPALVFQIRAIGLPAPVPEFKFWPGRKFAFDLAYPDHLLAVEVEGVVYPKRGSGGHLSGRHTSVKGFTRDIQKYGEAFAQGWSVLRVLPKDVKSGAAVSWIERRLKLAKPLLRVRAMKPSGAPLDELDDSYFSASLGQRGRG